MKVIIAGSREIDYFEVINDLIVPDGLSEIISGRAKGVDTLGEEFAKLNNIRLKHFPADWEAHGKSAGIIRNCEMGKYADGAIIFWDGKSKGTMNMISVMERLKKPHKAYVIGVSYEREDGTIVKIYNYQGRTWRQYPED